MGDSGIDPRRLVVLAVPHTGTRTLREILGCFSKHTWVSNERLAQNLVGSIVVTPLRDPREVWKSWLRRQGTIHESDLHRFNKTWRRLAELDDLYSIIYVPLDRPERDMQFAKIERAAGRTFNPNWSKKVGRVEDKELEYERPRVSDDGRDLSWIYDLPMVKQFYTQDK